MLLRNWKLDTNTRHLYTVYLSCFSDKIKYPFELLIKNMYAMVSVGVQLVCR